VRIQNSKSGSVKGKVDLVHAMKHMPEWRYRRTNS